MARISNEISSIEVAAYAEFCKANNIIHDGTPDDVANSDLVLEYFTKTWNEVINDQTLTQAFPQLKEHLKFNSAARIEVQRLVREYADANALSAWFDTQTLLSKEGDDGFRNFSEIVLELQGRPATQANISSAIMSIQRATEGGSVGKFSTRHRRPLVYAQKKTERTKSFHQVQHSMPPRLANMRRRITRSRRNKKDSRNPMPPGSAWLTSAFVTEATRISTQSSKYLTKLSHPALIGVESTRHAINS